MATGKANDPLALIYLPYFALVAFNACWQAVAGRPALRLRLPQWTVLVTLLMVVLFSILRNLPFAPFSFLAPHKI